MCHAVFRVSFLQQEQTDLFLPDLCWNFWIFTEVLEFLVIYENLEIVCVCGSLYMFPHTHSHFNTAGIIILQLTVGLVPSRNCVFF